MGLFPQFPYSNLHELNLDWIIEQIRQVTGEGVVLSVNGLSGVVTLYTENNITLPDCHFDTEWSVARLIDEKVAGLKFTGEKFFYITKDHDAEEFTVQEVYTSGNQPPYPVTSVNGHDGAVVLAGDNLPYVIDGDYTIEDIVNAIQSAIGAVITGKKCDQAVSAGQYVFLIMSNITGRADGLYKAVNNVSANTDWSSADLQSVSGGLGAEVATLNSQIMQANATLTDCNDATNGRAYDFGVSTLHRPDFNYGVLFQIGTHSDNTSYKMQIACDVVDNHFAFRRTPNDSWGNEPWIELAEEFEAINMPEITVTFDSNGECDITSATLGLSANVDIEIVNVVGAGQYWNNVYTYGTVSGDRVWRVKGNANATETIRIAYRLTSINNS